MRFGINDLHLLGKVLDHMDDAVLEDLDFTAGERRRAKWIFEDIDERLNETVGLEWNDEEVG